VRIDILYFAVLRERLKCERETVELPEGADVGAARSVIATRHPEIASLMPQIASAVNRSFAGAQQVLKDGDELALLPPVAGGAGSPPVAGGAGSRRIAIRTDPLTVADVVEAVGGHDSGGVVTFAGVVRRRGHHLPDVIRLEYEAYVEMAEAVLTEIADEIEREWPGTRVAIHHRIGALTVGEIAVAIAAASAHRAPAFDACRATIDRLKQRAPIWKKEVGESGEAWLGLGA
jgi:molybdopterin converting factor subunit 1